VLSPFEDLFREAQYSGLPAEMPGPKSDVGKRTLGDFFGDAQLRASNARLGYLPQRLHEVARSIAPAFQ
jgi:hypothetical protein